MDLTKSGDIHFRGDEGEETFHRHTRTSLLLFLVLLLLLMFLLAFFFFFPKNLNPAFLVFKKYSRGLCCVATGYSV